MPVFLCTWFYSCFYTLWVTNFPFGSVRGFVIWCCHLHILVPFCPSFCFGGSLIFFNVFFSPYPNLQFLIIKKKKKNKDHWCCTCITPCTNFVLPPFQSWSHHEPSLLISDKMASDILVVSTANSYEYSMMQHIVWYIRTFL